MATPSPANPRRADIAVVGAGAAGLHIALEAARAGADVRLISRKPLSESSSFWAQGGLAAAIAADDSPERHAEDTINAGRGLCEAGAVNALVRESPAAVERLIADGVEFDRDAEGNLALALEGGHSARRIVHAGGAETGKAITGSLARLAAAEPGIEILESSSALALCSDGERCTGVVTDAGVVEAGATVLATGGGAALWSRTTNPWGAVGAGAVLAHEAGAELAGLELCQFHPTALALPGTRFDGRLITEAVRGEGATLRDRRGRRFTDELAPRDQVTGAIIDRIAADGTDAVTLDLGSVPLERYPGIVAMLTAAGRDPRHDPVPVSPAAHYLIGGVRTDLQGATVVAGLLAVGECAYTGLHGANRLASNSLSECFVFGSRAVRAALAVAAETTGTPVAAGEWRFTPPTVETRTALWRLAGPQRTATALETLSSDPYPLARLIAASALLRTESRGAHRRTDHPDRDADLDGRHVVIGPDGDARLERWA